MANVQNITKRGKVAQVSAAKKPKQYNRWFSRSRNKL